MKGEFAMTFWDRFAGIYDIIELTNGKVYREMCATTRRLIPQGAKVLDCAAGTGELSFAAAVRAESVLCTDISENMLKTAKKKAAERRKDNISFAERNIFDLQESDNTYDIVIAGNVLHLLDNPQDAVRELYRVLKTGGKLLLPTFITKGHGEMMLKIYEKLGYNASASYSPETYKEMLKSCGIGKLRTKLIDGIIPCCYAVIEKV